MVVALSAGAPRGRRNFAIGVGVEIAPSKAQDSTEGGTPHVLLGLPSHSQEDGS